MRLTDTALETRSRKDSSTEGKLVSFVLQIMMLQVRVNSLLFFPSFLGGLSCPQRTSNSNNDFKISLLVLTEDHQQKEDMKQTDDCNNIIVSDETAKFMTFASNGRMELYK